MITPLFDPQGYSFVHQGNPLAKLLWVISIAVFVAVANEVISVAFVFVQGLVVFKVSTAHKQTPAPPVFWLVFFSMALLFTLNIVLADSKLGTWQESRKLVRIVFSNDLDYAVLRAVSIGATMVSFFTFTLTTVPRDLSRMMQRLRINNAICEALAIALRFLSVFEVNLKALYRTSQIKFVAINPGNRRKFITKSITQMLEAALVMALSQANITGKSLQLRNFTQSKKRHHYPILQNSPSNAFFVILIIINGALSGIALI